MYAVRNHGHDLSLDICMNKSIIINSYTGFGKTVSVSYF